MHGYHYGHLLSPTAFRCVKIESWDKLKVAAWRRTDPAVCIDEEMKSCISTFQTQRLDVLIVLTAT